MWPKAELLPLTKSMTSRSVRFLLACLVPLTLFFTCTSAFGQGSSQRMLPAAGENDQDQPQKRAEWNMRGRVAPKGESAAALRLRAQQQKMAMRAQRAIAEAARPAGNSPTAPTSWVSLGPSPLVSDAGNGQDYNWVSGRATSVLIDAADNTGNTVLLGGAYGGLWKSTNAGSKSASPSQVIWQALIDDQPSLAVGAIALQPGNSNVVLVGTGETNASGDSYYGMGILRSTDGGATWTQITSAASGQSFLGIGFSKIAFSSSNSNLAVATTAGDIGFDFGLEQDGVSTARGIYYSTNAGATWNRVILSDGAVPASTTGLVYNSTQGAFYAAIRRHGLYSSTDGQHFTRLTNQPIPGLATAQCPSGSNGASCQLYRAEFAVTQARNEMYVWIVDVQSGAVVDRGIWRTTNGGTAWTQISETGITHCGDSAFGPDSGCGVQQGPYNLELAAVPNSSGTDVYAGTINLYKCTLTSNAQTACSQGNWLNLTHVYGCNPLGAPAHVHPDQHGLAFMVVGGGAQSPGYFAHDGGISRTLDGFLGLNTGSCTGTNQFDSLSQTLGSMTEFVSFSVHPTSADILLGGTQDNGSPKTATGTSSTTWQNALSGDGGYNGINPNNGNEWFASNPGSIIGICEVGTSCDDNSFFLFAAPAPILGNIDPGAFYTPYILDPQSTGEMLIGTCRVWRGDTATGTFNMLSNNFDNLSPTLCTGGEINQVAGLTAGGPKDTHGFSNVVYATTWAYGPFAGLGGGEVWATINAAGGPAQFVNVTGSVNPNHYAIASVAIDTSDTTGKTAYVGIMGFHTSHVWKTTDAGGSGLPSDWKDWSGTGLTGLPDAPVSALLVDSAAGIIYAGTDVGVFSSPTTGVGGSWTEVGPVAGPSASGFLPSAPVTAIQIFNNGGTKKLRVSTYGRGIWEFALAVAPDYQVAVSNNPLTAFPSQTATFNGTLTAINGYSNPVTLSCGAGAPGACTFPAGNPITPTNGGAAFSVSMNSGVATADYNFNIHTVGSDANNVTHDTPVTLHVVDFGLTAPGAVNVQEGASGTAQFQVTALGSFAQSVTLSCSSGLPTGATCSFAPNPAMPTSGNPASVTLTVNAAANTPTGTTTVTIQGSTTNPAATRTTTFQLTVTAPPDFTWTGGGTHTVLAGQTTLSYAFTATPNGGTFTTAVTFACSNLPDATVTCAFNPAQIAAGAGATPVSLTITTAGPNTGTGTSRSQRADKRSPRLPLTLPIAGIIMAGIAGRRVSRRSAMAGMCVSFVLLALLVACGGGSSSPPPPPPPISVTVSPSTTVNLYANEAGNAWPANLTQQQFTAVVNNSTNQSVTWAVTGGAANGSIDSNGLYTAPAVVPNPATVTVKATAAADTSKSGTGKLNILTPTVLGTFPSISVTATEGVVSHAQNVSLTVQ
jgi:hypothetical protein